MHTNNCALVTRKTVFVGAAAPAMMMMMRRRDGRFELRNANSTLSTLSLGKIVSVCVLVHCCWLRKITRTKMMMNIVCIYV